MVATVRPRARRFFVIAEKYGLSGGQAPEVFLNTLDQTWAETHPLTLLTGATNTACDDGSRDVPWTTSTDR